MSQNEEIITDTITVTRIGPYGVQVGEKWYGLSKPLTPQNFRTGQTYFIKAAVAASGKIFIRSAIEAPNTMLPTDASFTRGVIAAASVKAAMPATGVTLSTYEEKDAAKQIRILRQGIYQAVVQSPLLQGFADSPEAYVGVVSKVAEALIQAVEQERVAA